MFRKTFIRLILVTAVATTSLLVFAATRTVGAAEDNKECSNMQNEECETTKSKNSYMILESFGRTLMNIRG
jgi:hypothetical protein